MEQVQRLVVSEDTAGMRLDRCLAESEEAESAGWSRSRISQWIRDGRVHIDQKAVSKPSVMVQVAQVIEIDVPPPPELELRPDPNVPFKIVYCDDDLAVVEKPSGVCVHPGAGHHESTLVHGLLSKFSLSPLGLPERPGIVHRIDMGTSGLLVVARSEKAHLGLVKLFAVHDIERRYFALVWDHDLPSQGRLSTPYGRHPGDRRKFTARNVVNGQLQTDKLDPTKPIKLPQEGKIATTNWRVIERRGPCALVECRLETGRTHQIRVHMSEMGSPLVGDPLYGVRRKVEGPLRIMGAEFGLERQALHACTLGFRHPVTGESLHFTSEWPADLARITEALQFPHESTVVDLCLCNAL